MARGQDISGPGSDCALECRSGASSVGKSRAAQPSHNPADAALGLLNGLIGSEADSPESVIQELELDNGGELGRLGGHC